MHCPSSIFPIHPIKHKLRQTFEKKAIFADVRKLTFRRDYPSCEGLSCQVSGQSAVVGLRLTWGVTEAPSACAAISCDFDVSNQGSRGGHDLRICLPGLSRVQRRVCDLWSRSGCLAVTSCSSTSARQHAAARSRDSIGQVLQMCEN